MAGIKFDITGDNSNMLSALQGVQNGVRQTARTVEQSGMSIEDVFKRIGSAATFAITGMSLQSLSKQVAQTRGEFQQLEIAFTTMLGSADKANDLMQQLTKTAATTPFDLQGVANGAKQLLAYGTEAKDVNSTLVKLGDIAAGLSINLQDLVWLYGTTMTQGKMFTMDLRQFQSRGIPMAEAIANVLGTTKDKVADLVTAGKVTSDVVKKAIGSIATGTGKFAGLMEAQSKSITGQISNIEDAYDMMLNEIGQSTEGIINTSLSSVSYLIENYEKVGSVIMGAVAAFGEYKASLMIVAATQQALARQNASIETSRQDGLTSIVDNYTATEKASQESASNDANTASLERNTIARNANRSAVDAQIAAIQTKLQADLAEKTSAAEAAAQALALAQNRKDEADRSVRAWQNMYDVAEKAGEVEKLEALDMGLHNAALEQNTANKELNTAQTNMRNAALQREAASTRLSTFQTQVDTVNTKANTTAKGLLVAITKSATAAFNSMKVAMASNPFTFAIIGLTTILSLLPLFSSETEEATDAQRKLRDTMQADQGKLIGYQAVLENCNRSSKNYADAVRGINEIAKQYHTTQIDGADAYDKQRRACDELTEAIKRQATEKILADSATEASKKNIQAEKDAIDKLINDAQSHFHTQGNDKDSAFGFYAVNLYSLKNISKDAWNTISADVIAKSEEIGKAFAKSSEEGEAMVKRETMNIKSMLKSMGASQHDIYMFTGAIEDYIRTCGESFSENNIELERTKAQLGGLQAATIDLGDITSENIKTYNYEQLKDAAAKVQEKIDTLNSTTTSPQVDDTELQNLKSLLQEINNLLPTTLTSGSNSDLSKRLQDAKNARDTASYGSQEYKDANALVGTLSAEMKKRQKGYAENAEKEANAGKKAAEKALRDRKQQNRERRKYEETVRKQELAEERRKIDLIHENAQAKIDAEADGSKKAIMQLQLDSEKKLEQLKREYEDLKQQKIDNARALFEANPANEGKEFNQSSVDTSYTEEEKKAYENKIKAVKAQLKRDLADNADTEEQAMLSYLQTYGSFQEQKLAIAREYAKKIADVQASADSEEFKSWQTKSLEKEMEEKQKAIEVQAITAKIDWYSVFDNVGVVMKSQLEPMLKELKAFTGTDKFKTLGADQQKTIVDAISNIRSQIGTSDIGFKELAADITAYQAALQAQREAEEQYNAVLEEYSDKLSKAQANLDRAKSSGVQKAIDNAQKEVDGIAQIIATAGEEYTAVNDNVTTQGRKLQQTAKDVIKPMSAIGTFLSTTGLSQLSELWNAFDELKGGIAGLKALGEAAKAAKGLQDTGKAISDATDKAADGLSDVGKVVSDSLADGLNKAGLIGQIVAAVLKILDILKDGISTLISSVIDSVLGAINGILEDILSGKFLIQVGSSLVKGLGNILDTITGKIGSVLSFGALSSGGVSSWFKNSNAKEVAETTERLTKANERLKDSIDGLKNEISKSVGVNSIKSAQEALDSQKQLIENQREILNTQQNYHGSHHSNAKNWWLDTDTQSQINAWLAEYAKKNGLKASTVGAGWDSFSKLSAEEMDYIRKHDAELWSKLTDIGKYDKSDYFDAYADLAGSMKEITDNLNEVLTTTTADNVFDDFLNSLYNLADGSEDVFDDIAEAWQKMVNRMAINNIIGDSFQSKLKEWYNELADINKKRASGEITDEEYKRELERLKGLYDGYINSAKDSVEQLTDLGVIKPTEDTYSQKASSKGFAAMSQDTAEELNGRFTALQISNENISQQVNVIASTIASMLAYNISNTQNISEIRNMMIISNSYLEDIAKFAKLQYNEFGAKLDTIAANTKKL